MFCLHYISQLESPCPLNINAMPVETSFGKENQASPYTVMSSSSFLDYRRKSKFVLEKKNQNMKQGRKKSSFNRTLAIRQQLTEVLLRIVIVNFFFYLKVRIHYLPRTGL